MPIVSAGRGSGQTLELSTGVGKVHAGAHCRRSVVLLDCLTLLVSNTMLQDTRMRAEPDEKAARAAVEQEIELLLEAIRQSDIQTGSLSRMRLGRESSPRMPRDGSFATCWAGQTRKWPRQADEVIWMVAGIPVPIGQHRPGAQRHSRIDGDASQTGRRSATVATTRKAHGSSDLASSRAGCPGLTGPLEWRSQGSAAMK